MKCFGCGSARSQISCVRLGEQPGAATERPVVRAEGPRVDGVTAPVGSDGSPGEGEQVDEKDEVSELLMSSFKIGSLNINGQVGKTSV